MVLQNVYDMQHIHLVQQVILLYPQIWSTTTCTYSKLKLQYYLQCNTYVYMHFPNACQLEGYEHVTDTFSTVDKLFIQPAHTHNSTS